MYFSCGCIGHKDDTNPKSPEQISASMQRQLVSAKDMEHVHFVNDARAFAKHPSRRTSQISLHLDGGEPIYYPFNVQRADINVNTSFFPSNDLTNSLQPSPYDSDPLEEFPTLEWNLDIEGKDQGM